MQCRPAWSNFFIMAYAATVFFVVSAAKPKPTPAMSPLCPRLTDANNTLLRSLVRMGNLSDYQHVISNQVFAPLDAAFPWISQCLASLDPDAMLQSAFLVDAELGCSSHWNTAVPPSDLNNAYFRDYLCPLYVDTVLPCVTKMFVRTFTQAINGSSGGCCDEFQHNMALECGSGNLTALVQPLLQVTGNVLCSVKTTADRSISQYCGYTLLTSLLSDRFRDTVESLLQIPNTQACRAMTGKQFFTTRSMSTQLSVDNGEHSIGICYAAVDAWLLHMQQYPIVRDLFSVMGVKAAAKQRHDYAVVAANSRRHQSVVIRRCMRGDVLLYRLNKTLGSAFAVVDTLLSSLASGNSSIVSAGDDAESEDDGPILWIHWAREMWSHRIRSAMQSLCLNLPSGLNCKYDSETLALAFPSIESVMEISTLSARDSSSARTDGGLISTAQRDAMVLLLTILLML